MNVVQEYRKHVYNNSAFEFKPCWFCCEDQKQDVTSLLKNLQKDEPYAHRMRISDIDLVLNQKELLNIDPEITVKVVIQRANTNRRGMESILSGKIPLTVRLLFLLREVDSNGEVKWFLYGYSKSQIKAYNLNLSHDREVNIVAHLSVEGKESITVTKESLERLQTDRVFEDFKRTRDYGALLNRR
jgi:hypothetical protein